MVKGEFPLGTVRGLGFKEACLPRMKHTPGMIAQDPTPLLHCRLCAVRPRALHNWHIYDGT